MSFGGGIGEIPSAEMALALRRRAARAESPCVLADVPALYRPACPCWPCRLGRAREERRARIARIKARLGMRQKLDAG